MLTHIYAEEDDWEVRESATRRDKRPMELTGEAEIPFEFSLSQNYPNPFNPSTTIRYGLLEGAIS